MRIAFAGNPNSGKTTMYNALTGRNEKKENIIDVDALSKKLGRPVVDTTSTTGEGLAELIKEAVSLKSQSQKAPYDQGNVDLTNKDAVVDADKKRFEFVNKIVSSVEKRKVLTKNRNFQDKIDDILTNKWLGLPIFALVMFLVFDISQSSFGPFLADTLVAWLEGFRGCRLGRNSDVLCRYRSDPAGRSALQPSYIYKNKRKKVSGASVVPMGQNVRAHAPAAQVIAAAIAHRIKSKLPKKRLSSEGRFIFPLDISDSLRYNSI